MPPDVLTAPVPLTLPAVSFFGRSLNEYASCFALDLPALRDRAVLDVGAGPSSFTAEACRRGVDAVAIDPLYGAAPEQLARRIDDDYGHMFAQMRAKPRLFRVGGRSRGAPLPAALARRWPAPPSARQSAGARDLDGAAKSRPPAYFASMDEAEVDRRAAAQRFLSDYEARLWHGRYVEGGLPRLPFLDGAFDLVLCAHLLFLYAERFDRAWHLAACRELVRVSAGEVRIHPLCGLGGKPYAQLDLLRRELLDVGVTSEIVRVPYEFFVGGSSMLVLRGRKGAA